MLELLEGIHAGALHLGTKELTKRRRTGRIFHRSGQQMEPRAVRFARNEELVRLARNANVEEQEAIAGLMDLLHPSVEKSGADFVKYTINFDGAQCHVAAASWSEVTMRRSLGCRL
jgi:hypothetical protein